MEKSIFNALWEAYLRGDIANVRKWGDCSFIESEARQAEFVKAHNFNIDEMGELNDIVNDSAYNAERTGFINGLKMGIALAKELEIKPNERSV